MSALENLLIPGSTQMPDCPCGAEMRLLRLSHAKTQKFVFLDVILVIMSFS